MLIVSGLGGDDLGLNPDRLLGAYEWNKRISFWRLLCGAFKVFPRPFPFTCSRNPKNLVKTSVFTTFDIWMFFL